MFFLIGVAFLSMHIHLETKMKIVTMSAVGLMLSGSVVLAGGFELQTLDTSPMYENGGFGSFLLRS